MDVAVVVDVHWCSSRAGTTTYTAATVLTRASYAASLDFQNFDIIIIFGRRPSSTQSFSGSRKTLQHMGRQHGARASCDYLSAWRRRGLFYPGRA